MAYNIYHSIYTKDQLDQADRNKIPQIDPTTYQWKLWNIANKSWDLSDVVARGVTVTQVVYQSSSSGTVVPSTWQRTIPSVPQEWYLWTRIDYSDGTYAYTVSRQGKDGTGAGDMTKAIYDSDLSIQLAGGIKSYVDTAVNDVQTDLDALGLTVVSGQLCAVYTES